jgi:hypothetical protein
MTKCRTFFAALLLTSFAFAYGENSGSGTDWSRMITQFGFGSTVGDPLSSNDLGFTVTFRNFFFLNPKLPDGAYVGFFGSTIVHTAGKTEIGDMRWGTLGYRSVFGPEWLSLDASVSFVQGSRMTGSELNGSGYIGIGPAFGAYAACGDNLDLGVSVEPVFNLLSLKSDSSVKAKSYTDIVFFICFKNLLKSERLPWRARVE